VSRLTVELRMFVTVGFVLCLHVSAGCSGANERFDVTAESVFDKDTGLEWERYIPVRNPTMGINWEDAKAYCALLWIGGNADWRVPELKELLSLFDYSKGSLATDAFPPAGPDGMYWSSSEAVFDTTKAWSFFVVNGGTDTWNKAGGSMTLRCVRTATGG
jgi:hypothetical protein